MKRILTLSAIALIFASNFANASTLVTGNGGKATVKATVKTAKTHFSKISAKEFSIKKMQDTKDILMPLSIVDYSTKKS